MARGMASAGRLGRVSLTLAALALFVRLLVPAGYMLATESAANALPGLVICTGQGAMVLTLDASGRAVPPDPGKSHSGQPDSGKSKGGDHPCTYASAAATHATPLLSSVDAPVRFAAVAAPPLLTTQRPGLGLAAPPPFTTGPPSIT